MGASRKQATPEEELARLKKQYANMAEHINRLKLIRALHVTAYHAQAPIAKFAEEFFFAVGDVLEGMGVEQLSLSHISHAELKREFEDGRSEGDG